MKSTKCNAEIKLKLDETDIRMLKNYKLNFESWGLFYNIKNKQTAIFTKIPICWESKDERVRIISRTFILQKNQNHNTIKYFFVD